MDKTSKVRYTVIEHDETHQESTIFEFLNALHIITNRGLIPSQVVLNSIFLQGELNAGMGGVFKWTPFEIDEFEYKDIVSSLIAARQCIITDAPGWVNDYETWSIWEMELLDGVPAKEHLIFSETVKGFKQKRDKAHAEGDKEKTRYYDALSGEAALKLSEFIEKHRKNNPLTGF